MANVRIVGEQKGYVMPKNSFEEDELMSIFTCCNHVRMVAARSVVHTQFGFPNYLGIVFGVQHPAVDAVS